MTNDMQAVGNPRATAVSPDGLSGNTLKWIAILCMLIDHMAWAFVETASPLGAAMHFVGRVTGPAMFFSLRRATPIPAT